MWGSLLVLALLTTINPVRLGLILLVLSRPRPIRNLLAYWTGALMVGLVTLLVPLLAMHATPASASFLEGFAHPNANPTAQRIAIGTGVALLLVAAPLVARSLVRTPSESHRRKSPARTGGTNTSTLVLDSTAPPVILRLLHPAEEVDTEGGTRIRRLLRHIRSAWRDGSPRVSFFIGVIVVPPLDGVLFGLAIIVASGAAIEIQTVAVIAYILGVLLIEEIILISNLVAPVKTQTALGRLYDLARAHRQMFVAAVCAVVGASLVVRGMGGM